MDGIRRYENFKVKILSAIEICSVVLVKEEEDIRR
jgi:hypothetical protein